MTLPKSRFVRESLACALFIAAGFALSPFLFYETSTLESLWGDGVYTVTAFDRFWDDVRYREIKEIWWKVLLPYAVFLIVRLIVSGASMFRGGAKKPSGPSGSPEGRPG
jgi:hypothetical protein